MKLISILLFIRIKTKIIVLHRSPGTKVILQAYIFVKLFWNEVPYIRVAQGTYSTKSETLPLPWPAFRYHSQRSLARPYAVGMLR